MTKVFIGELGSKWWYKNSNHHRLNGPAITRINGQSEYWINGRELSEYEHMFLTIMEIEND